MANILETLINASEKAACIARSCCTGSDNEVLLVAEKVEDEANARFEHDFKTIADVLAQETICNEITSHFPSLITCVRGEECSEMGGVRIKIQSDAEATAEMLRTLVAPGIAKRMAEAAHCNTEHGFCDNLPKTLTNIDPSDLGIWIDPIDATAEFIAGVRGEADADRGLPCVTVLIGAYLRSTGEPVIGVINQPFYNNGKGRVAWGVKYGDIQEWGGSDEVEKNMNTILMSGAENPEILAKFKNAGWEVKSVPGAGHKLLKVALGEAAAYLVSKATTFRWDTCGAHSILRSKGGDIITFASHTPIAYYQTENNVQDYCNYEGIIAYNNAPVLEKIKNVL